MATFSFSGNYSLHGNDGFKITIEQTQNTSNRTSTFRVSEMQLNCHYYQYHWFTGTVSLGGQVIYTGSAQNGDTGVYANALGLQKLTTFSGVHAPLVKTHSDNGSLGAMTLSVSFTLIGGQYSGSTNSRGTVSLSATLTPSAMGAKTYTISYNANGGTGAPSAQTKTYGTALTLSSTKPSKNSTTSTGYTVTFNGNGGTPSKTSQAATDTTSYNFSKWNTKANGTGTSYNSGASYTANAAVTLYAQYSSSTSKGSITAATASRNNGTSTRTVTFKANGGSCSVSSASSTATITYTCKGWYTDASGGSLVVASGGKYTPSATGTVYAQWDSSIGNYSVITLPTPTRTGYIFKGWNESSSASSGLTGSYTPTKNITLYAIWESEEVIKKDAGYKTKIKTSSGWKDFYAYVYKNGEWIRRLVYIFKQEG